ncbi:MAG: hypothetical protein WC484_07090 [Candidatus Omnitrophota bacterium]
MYIDGVNLKLSSNELVGQYITPVRDVGYIAPFGVVVEAIIAITAALGFNTDAVRRFNTSSTLRFTGEEAVGALTFEIRYSEDGADPEIDTWTDWLPFKSGDYYCRWFQLRMTITRQALDIDLVCSKFDYTADLPDVNEKGVDEVTVAVTGKAVVFTNTFHTEPVVNISILSGTGVYYRFSAKDSTGFTVILYDVTGTEVVGDFEFHAYGV